ncbi:PREDICTED: latrophilin-3-like [Priapulus caudatus]|uniref:Latrophilin-3-like n=1 Tax=Priapulus caudatus TaxID=37621 RepID=A0ABM1EUY8_PRICU|nr:PREDICTED: latrophilin-3-like [Priapulus caudatus]
MSKSSDLQYVRAKACNAANAFICATLEPNALATADTYSYQCLCPVGYRGLHCEQPHEDEPGSPSNHVFCENQKFSIYCSGAMHLSFDYAAYGYIGTTTSCQSYVSYSDCLAYNSLSLIRQRCQGRKLCEFRTIVSEWFDYDPCPDTFKHIMMRFQCRNDVKKCPDGSSHFAENCYQVVTNATKTWSEARYHCQNTGGDLVSINSDNEEAFLLELAKSVLGDYPLDMYFWTALKRTKKGITNYKWVDGAASNYTNWKPYWIDYNGDEACMFLLAFEKLGQYRFYWDSGDCALKHHFICRFPPHAISQPQLTIPPKPESTTPDPTQMCDEVEVRGIVWPATPFGEVAVQPCPDGVVGYATWTCDNVTEMFTPEDPDLSLCKHAWVDVIDSMIEDGDDAATITGLLAESTASGSSLYGGDVLACVDYLGQLSAIQSQQVAPLPEEEQKPAMLIFSEVLCNVSSNLLFEEQNPAWTDIPQVQRNEAVMLMLGNMDNNSFLLGQYMQNEKEQIYVQNLVMQVQVHTDPTEEFSFSVDNSEGVFQGSTSSEFTIPLTVLDEMRNGLEVQAAFFIYSNLHELLPVENMLSYGFWDTEGCRSITSTANATVCACSHLTSFAVLMDISGSSGNILDKVHQVALDVITYIGCIVSIICLALAIFTFSYFRQLWCDRNTIHRNLCISLLAAELLFIIGIDQTINKVRENVTRIPALIVGIAASVQPSGYGTEYYCWLRSDTNFIWSFIAPVCAVIVVNIVCLVIALKVVFSVQSGATKMTEETTVDIVSPEGKAIRGWLKGSVMLLCLLGITWLFGLLYINNSFIAFAYIFTIFNSLQGLFIFVFHCLMNEKVQKAFAKFVRRSSSCPQCMKDAMENYGPTPSTYTSSTSAQTQVTRSKMDKPRDGLLAKQTDSQSATVPMCETSRRTSSNTKPSNSGFISSTRKKLGIGSDKVKSKKQPRTQSTSLHDSADRTNASKEVADVEACDKETRGIGDGKSDATLIAVDAAGDKTAADIVIHASEENSNGDCNRRSEADVSAINVDVTS